MPANAAARSAETSGKVGLGAVAIIDRVASARESDYPPLTVVRAAGIVIVLRDSARHWRLSMTVLVIVAVRACGRAAGLPLPAH